MNLNIIILTMSAYGIFEHQSVHLLDHVIQKITYSDLFSLAQTSHIWYNIIRQHVNSAQFQKHAVFAKDLRDLGRLIAIVSNPDEFDLIQSLTAKIWEAEQNFDRIGNLVQEFCSVSSKLVRHRVSEMFNFTWNLTATLDSQVFGVNEPAEEIVNQDDIHQYQEDMNRIEADEMKQKIKLRGQLASLFFTDSSSVTYRFFLIELIRKLRNVLDNNQSHIATILQLLLNPFKMSEGELIINMFFDWLNDTEQEENLKNLQSIAKAFKGLQRTCSTEEETEFCMELFEFFANWNMKAKATILVHEPSLLSWYIKDHSFLVVMSPQVAGVLADMTLMMTQNHSKSKEFYQELVKLRKATLQEVNGMKHWADLMKRTSEVIKMRSATLDR